jgi:hypothetical protein
MTLDALGMTDLRSIARRLARLLEQIREDHTVDRRTTVSPPLIGWTTTGRSGPSPRKRGETPSPDRALTCSFCISVPDGRFKINWYHKSDPSCPKLGWGGQTQEAAPGVRAGCDLIWASTAVPQFIATNRYPMLLQPTT